MNLLPLRACEAAASDFPAVAPEHESLLLQLLLHKPPVVIDAPAPGAVA